MRSKRFEQAKRCQVVVNRLYSSSDMGSSVLLSLSAKSAFPETCVHRSIFSMLVVMEKGMRSLLEIKQRNWASEKFALVA